MEKEKTHKVLVIHGPNLNLLGEREPDIYGRIDIEEINRRLKKKAAAHNLGIEIVQSNYEGEICEIIGKAKERFSALIINPAAYTHTSIAIRDAIQAVGLPTVEVHLSNIYCREDFRRLSLISPVAKGQICGFGVHSYLLGLEACAKFVK